MSKTRTTAILAVSVLVIALIAGKVINQARGDVAQDAYTGIIPVSGFVLRPAPFTKSIQESGTLKGKRESVLAAEIGGQIEQIYVEVGDYVKQGQALLRLDDELLKLEAERALIAYDKARLDFDRVEKLYQERSISDSDYEGVRLALKAAEVQQRYAKKTFEDATTRAPFSGTIAARMTEVGQMLDRGQPVFQLVDTEKLKLPIAVTESEIHEVAVGASAKVFVEALADTFPAEVTAVGPRAMQGARTFPVEITLDAADGLKSGMFARAVIFAGVDSASLLVPRAATLPDVGRTVVFTVQDGKANKVPVKILGMSEDLISVTGPRRRHRDRYRQSTAVTRVAALADAAIGELQHDRNRTIH
ncbi:MAG: efflux RND transporter periplasmic adaptor subunit [bacterium]|nr:efflux RND transporter periplasmic adaptor subunit [bacterium]